MTAKIIKKRPEFPERVTDVFVALMLSAFVLICRPYENITELKYQVFLWLCGGYIVIMAVLGLEMLITRQASLPKLKTLIRGAGPVRWLVIAYLLFTALSALLSPYEGVFAGQSRYEGLLTIAIYCVGFLLVSKFGRPALWQAYLFGAVMTAFCVLSLIQLGGGDPLSLYPQGCTYFDAYVKYSGEFFGTTGNADLSAALLCLAAPVFYAVILRGTGKGRFLLLLPLNLCLAVLALAGVSAGLVGIAVMFLVVTPIAAKLGKKGRMKLIICEAAACVLGLATVYFYDFSGSGTLYELHSLLHGTVSDSFGTGRIKIWRSVLARLPKHFWLGTGPDTMSSWGLEGFSRYIESTGQTVRAEIDVAHCEYLNILAQQGFFAFAAYLTALVCAAGRFIRTKKTPASCACAGAVLCYCAQALFGFSMCITAPLFWLALGLLVSTLKAE